MKKVILICLMLSVVLGSCGKPDLNYPNTDTGTVSMTRENPNVFLNQSVNTDFPEEDLYQYFKLQLKNSSVLARFNVTTGKVTPLCPDPVCDHGEECLFSGASGQLTLKDNTIFFMRWIHSMYDSTEEILKYDIATGKIKIIYSCTSLRGTNQSLIVFGYYWLRNDYLKVFYRVNLETGVREELNPEYLIPSKFIDGRFYCQSKTELYSLNSNMEDKKILLKDRLISICNFDYFKQGFIVCTLYCPGCDPEHETIRINLADGTTEPSDLPIHGLILYSDGKSYYPGKIKYEDRRLLGIDGHNGPQYNDNGGKIMCFDPATGEETLIFENDDYYLSVVYVLAGKYLVVDYGEFVYRPDKDFDSLRPNGGKIVIDTETHDYHIYRNEWDYFAGVIRYS